MRNTYTGLKTEHAELVYKNHYKGDPPFKPQKGNFGSVSWFFGSGNAYVGGQTQSYTVKVDVGVPDQIQKLDLGFFNQFVTDYLKKTDVNLDFQPTHRAFWEALGAALEKYNIVEVFVPKCAVSRQGSGTFIAASASGRLAVVLTNPAKLRQDLIALGVNVNALEQAVDARDATNAASFSLEFASVKPAFMGQTFIEFMYTLRRNVQTPWAIVPISETGRVVPAVVPPGANPIIAAAYRDRKKVTVTLAFADFKAARQQAKFWALLKSNVTIANEYGGLTVIGGLNWSAKAVRAYTANY